MNDATAETALARAWSELRSGEFLNAYDIAKQALDLLPTHQKLAHVACLALARSGATVRADQTYRSSGLDNWANEDGIGLRARIAKDMALSSPDPATSPDLGRSIEAYGESYELDRGYYPAINIAFLHMLAGDRKASTEWATTALVATGTEANYYAEATRAEALLLLGKPIEAAASILLAAELSAANPGERSTTWKQLQMVCQHLGQDAEILTPLKPGPVLHYSGHIISAPGKAGRFPADQEKNVQKHIRAFLDHSGCSRVFGSLAAGADILVAEAALDAGCSLTVVLPFDAEEFRDVSVAGSKGDWAVRFEHCLERASDVLFVTPDAYLGDDSLFGYATQFALGLARQQADWLQTDALQVAISDGRAGPNTAAGTSFDINTGAAAGFKQTIIPVRSTIGAAATGTADTADLARQGRVARTMIFGDLKGFSKLSDAQMPAFVNQILGAMSVCLEDYQTDLLFKNTWGDGIYLVFAKPDTAARCGFALQDAVADAVQNSTELPGTLGLRLGIHYGPVYEIDDPVMGNRNFFGSHVSHAARTEPRTPEGEIYVTAQTAAAIALESRDRYRCDYVGRIPLAKDHGAFPMYHLKRVRP